MEINIYIIKSQKNKKNKAPLRMHIGGYIKIPLGISVSVDNWSEKKQRVTSSEPFYFKINERLESKIKIITEYVNSVDSPDESKIKELLKEPKEEPKKEAEKISLIAHCRKYIERQKKIKSGSHGKNLKSALDHFEEFNPRVKEVDFEYLEKFTQYLIDKKSSKGEQCLENVTIEGYINKIKTMLLDARDSGYKINKDIKDYTFRSGKYLAVRLTWEEVEQLDRFEHYDPEYNKVKDSYIFRCNTGLRDIDYNNLNEHTFIKKDGKVFIKINSNKKEKDQLLVLNSRALQIARKYNFNLPKCSQQHFNRIIKKVARAAKINSKVERIRHNGKKRVVTIKEKWNTISTHGARRTFARRWYDLGGDIRLISHFLGHESEQETRHYIGLTDDDTNEEMIRVFDQGEIFK